MPKIVEFRPFFIRFWTAEFGFELKAWLQTFYTVLYALCPMLPNPQPEPRIP